MYKKVLVLYKSEVSLLIRGGGRVTIKFMATLMNKTSLFFILITGIVARWHRVVSAVT